MKIFSNNKIILNVVIIVVIFSTGFSTLIPNTAYAQLATFDGANVAQTTVTASNTGLTTFSVSSLQLKENVLDGVASMMIKGVIRMITSSVVSWINSGFQGSPSFIQNPGSFFLDVADQATGALIAAVGGPVSKLCTPFSFNINLALRLKYRPAVLKRYTCTLSTLIKNTQYAIANSSINGFTAGDFRQGGWPAFVSMTTEPQNNIYGAYIMSDFDLSWRVIDKSKRKTEELNQGRGFLSWRDSDCISKVKESNDKIKSGYTPPSDIPGPEGIDIPNESIEYNGPLQDPESACPIKTPGSVINSTLQNHLDGPLKELQVADEINEVLNALFAQLATQVLQKGLSAVNVKDSSGTSYLQRTRIDDTKEATQQLKSLKDELSKSTSGYKKSAIEYKKYRDQALAMVNGIKNTYDNARACYVSKQSNPYAQSQISQIDYVVTNRLNPKIDEVTTLQQKAEENIQKLTDIENQANAAKTPDEISKPSEKFSKLLQEKDLIIGNDIQQAKEDLKDLKDFVQDISNDAQSKLNNCRLL